MKKAGAMRRLLFYLYSPLYPAVPAVLEIPIEISKMPLQKFAEHDHDEGTNECKHRR